MCSLYLPMKGYLFCITFTPTAYATNDTTIIHHAYKPDFAVYVSVCRSPEMFFMNEGYIVYVSSFQENLLISTIIPIQTGLNLL